MKNAQKTLDLSRRHFVMTSLAVAGGFAVGCSPTSSTAPGAAATEMLKFGNFVRIGSDGVVTVIAKLLEMGQGTHTGLAAIVAEELDADWSKVRIETSPADPLKYYNTGMGPGFMIVGGSSGISNSWNQLRDAGAAARSMLVAAAGKAWSVPVGEIQVKDGLLSHASGKSAGFGEFAAAAAKMPMPEKPTLKEVSKFTLVGTDRLRRLDGHAKATGQTKFTIDTKPEGTRAAVVARAPKFGAKVKSFNAAEALKLPSVIKVVQIPTGVAVVADNHWAAVKGREALSIDWDFSQAEKRSSSDFFEEYRTIVSKPGNYKVKQVGDTAKAFAGAANTIEAVFEFPYLAHAAMEPLNAVAKVADFGVEIWTGSQAQTLDIINATTAAAVPPTKVKIHTLPSGGSFGRRAVLDSDYVIDAVHCAKAMNDGKPVSVQWTREDDMTAGRFRPMTVHAIKVGLNEAGDVVAWQSSSVAQSLSKGSPMEEKGKVDSSVIEGLVEAPLLSKVSNIDITASHGENAVPVLWWRSVGHTHTAFVLEHMVDLCAKSAGKDPVDYRQSLYKESPRYLAALNLAVEKSGYGSALPSGRAFGVAVHESFGSVVAQIAEVSIVDSVPKVHKVTVAFDCGIAVVPDQVRAQSEGALGFGLGAVLYGNVTIKEGEVEQKNFDAYQVLRMGEMPIVETHIVPSTNAPSGVGEPGTPPIGPAVANAVLKLTGKPTFKLPFKQA